MTPRISICSLCAHYVHIGDGYKCRGRDHLEDDLGQDVWIKKDSVLYKDILNRKHWGVPFDSVDRIRICCNCGNSAEEIQCSYADFLDVMAVSMPKEKSSTVHIRKQAWEHKLRMESMRKGLFDSIWLGTAPKKNNISTVKILSALGSV